MEGSILLFSSSIFIFAFLPCVLFGYYIVFRKSRKARNVFLTICSLLFYAWGEPAFVLVMCASILGNWAFALWVDRRRARPRARLVIAAMLAMNLGILFVFKYLVFVLTNIRGITGWMGGIPDIVLPIGISFFTFQAISYVIDVYRKKGEAQRSPLNVALYISFFPQLIAGPIVRYETIASQIKDRRETFSGFSEGLCRFIVGLAKKMLLANNLAIVADQAFGATEHSVAFAWLGAIAYAFQIFFDFSGYSDMAIGLGRMFGFRFLENFNYPYVSKSITEFWRRWHISLGTWFRDYVYIPLGGSRVGSKGRLVLNLFVVWSLTGVWHGANWTFVLWGLMYFALITLEKLTGFDKKLKGFGHIYALFFVLMGWVLFRADSVGDAFVYMGHMFGVQSAGLVDNVMIFWLREDAVFFVAALVLSLPLAKRLSEKWEQHTAYKVAYPLMMLSLLFLTISYVAKGAYNPFIYFNF